MGAGKCRNSLPGISRTVQQRRPTGVAKGLFPHLLISQEHSQLPCSRGGCSSAVSEALPGTWGLVAGG